MIPTICILLHTTATQTQEPAPRRPEHCSVQRRTYRCTVAATKWVRAIVCLRTHAARESAATVIGQRLRQYGFPPLPRRCATLRMSGCRHARRFSRLLQTQSSRSDPSPTLGYKALRNHPELTSHYLPYPPGWPRRCHTQRTYNPLALRAQWCSIRVTYKGSKPHAPMRATGKRTPRRTAQYSATRASSACA